MSSRKLNFQSPDFYGASDLIFKDVRRPLSYRGSWVHGIEYAFSNYIDANTILHYYEHNLPYHLVNNSYTENIIKKEGYEGVAVGIPYIYTDYKKETIRSIDRLYMPSHSIKGVCLVDEYQNWFDIAHKNQCSAMCVTKVDFNNILDNRYLKNRGVELIPGAAVNDRDSLIRMAQLFGQTIEVLSDSFGSHVVYAALSGASVRMLTDMKTSQNRRLEIDKKIIETFPIDKRKSMKNYLRGYHQQSEGKLIFLQGNDKEIKEFSEYAAGVSHKNKVENIQNYLTPKSNLQALKIMTTNFSLKLKGRIKKHC